MEIQIKATNIKLTNDISAYLDKRLKMLDRLIDPNDTSVKCQVEVEKTTKHHRAGEVYRSEVNLHIAGAKFRAESTKEKLFDAIDETKSQMHKELRRHKSRQNKSVRKGGAEIKKLLKEQKIEEDPVL